MRMEFRMFPFRFASFDINSCELLPFHIRYFLYVLYLSDGIGLTLKPAE